MSRYSEAAAQEKPAGTKRNEGIDLLRIICMYMIVILHVLGQGSAMAKVSGHMTTYWICWLLETLSFGAVNCYAMISGYVCVGRRWKLSGIIKLYLRVWFYSVLITLLFLIFDRGIFTRASIPDSFSSFGRTGFYWTLKTLFPLSMSNYWYFSCYVGVFFMSPFLDRMMDSMNKEELKRLLKIIVILFSVYAIIPKALYSDVFKLVSGYSFAWLLLLYMAGGTLRRLKFSAGIRRRWMLPAMWALLCVVSWGWKIAAEGVTKKIFGKALFGQVLINYTSPTILIGSLCLVVFFSGLKLKNSFIRKLTRVLSPLSFSVYLIHAHPLIWEGPLNKAFTAYRTLHPLLIAPVVLLTAAGIFIVCCAADYLRSLLVRILRLDRLLRRRAETD